MDAPGKRIRPGYPPCLQSTAEAAAPARLPAPARARSRGPAAGGAATASGKDDRPRSSPEPLPTALDMRAVVARLRLLAGPHMFLSWYQSHSALSALNALSAEDAEGSWALRVRARAYYELADYARAADAFADAFAADPHRLAGVADLYSTTLWQLRRDVDLATLAHALEEQHPKVKGPCRDHGAAAGAAINRCALA